MRGFLAIHRLRACEQTGVLARNPLSNLSPSHSFYPLWRTTIRGRELSAANIYCACLARTKLAMRIPYISLTLTLSFRSLELPPMNKPNTRRSKHSSSHLPKTTVTLPTRNARPLTLTQHCFFLALLWLTRPVSMTLSTLALLVFVWLKHSLSSFLVEDSFWWGPRAPRNSVCLRGGALSGRGAANLPKISKDGCVRKTVPCSTAGRPVR